MYKLMKQPLYLTIVFMCWLSLYTIMVQRAHAQAIDTTHFIQVEGTVKKGDQQPLSGINVQVLGYTSAFTNEAGHFRIKVPHAASELIFNGAGLQQKIVPINGHRQLDVIMYEVDFKSTYQEIALPYGKYPLLKTGWAVGNTQLQNAWQSSGETPDTYLQGQLAGLSAVRRSGTPNSGANLYVRGFTSLYGQNQPLIVVDGMIYDNESYGKSIIGGHSFNPLAHIDVRDIDEITLLKDGNTTYGSRAANGVLLIQTTRAKEEATAIDFAAYGGFNAQPQSLPLLNAHDYRIYLADVLQSKGLTMSGIDSLPYMNDGPNPDYYRFHQQTDWQEEVFQNGINQNYYLKVRGGDNIALYGLSVGYTTSDGPTRNTDFNRYFMRFNGDLKLGTKLTAAVNLSFSSLAQNLRDQGNNRTNPLVLAQIKAPFLSAHEITDAGLVSPNLAEVDIFGLSNPRAITDQAIGTNRNYRFFGSTTFRYQFSDKLHLQTLVGVTYDKIREAMFIPQKGVVPDTIYTAVAKNRSGSNVSRLFTLYNDTRLSFQQQWGSVHTLAARIGARYSHSSSENDYGYGFNSATDDLVTVGNGVGELRQLGGSLGKWSWLNIYTNADYDYLNRYFFSANLTIDGSSRFGQQADGGIRINGSPYAVMPSVAAAWLLSSEEFLASQHTIDLLKLRASYGWVANEQIGNYSARKYYTTQNLLGMQGLVRANIGNPYLKWETIKKLNVGLDLAVFNERLRMTVDAFSNRTNDMLYWQYIPAATGVEYMLTNGGAMQTKGLELAVDARMTDRQWKWDIGFNISFYRNKITKLPANALLTNYGHATYMTQVGQAANLFYGYQTNGVFTTAAAAAEANQYVRTGATLSPFTAGDVYFVNHADSPEDQTAGVHVIDEQDRQVIGNPNPDFTGAISSRLAWNRWALDVLCTFSYGNDIYNAQRAYLETQGDYNNQSITVMNRWRADGQATHIPKATWGDPMGNARFSDRWIEDGSYLRLRTISLTYQLPFTDKLIKNATLFATANNLLTFTRYKGYDPEFSAMSGLFGQGVDNWLEPQFISTQLGIRLGL